MQFIYDEKIFNYFAFTIRFSLQDKLLVYDNKILSFIHSGSKINVLCLTFWTLKFVETWSAHKTKQEASQNPCSFDPRYNCLVQHFQFFGALYKDVAFATHVAEAYFWISYTLRVQRMKINKKMGKSIKYFYECIRNLHSIPVL